MSMTCSFFLTLGKVTPEVFFLACLLGAEKQKRHRHQADMMMPAQPVPPFVVIQSQLLFQFSVIQLYAPAGSCDADEATQPDRLPAPVRQPVFDGLRRLLRPFHQEPLRHPRRMFLFPPAVRGPHLDLGEAGALDSSAAFPPGHRSPSRTRQLS